MDRRITQLQESVDSLAEEMRKLAEAHQTQDMAALWSLPDLAETHHQRILRGVFGSRLRRAGHTPRGKYRKVCSGMRANSTG
jgi:hypothetical protein